MPHLVFLLIASGLGYGAWALHQKGKQAKDAPPPPAPAPEPNAEASWDDLQPVDTLGLEVGYRLIALVDKARQGDLLARIKGVRRKFAQDVGFLPPPVHIRDNLELKPSAYRLSLRGAVVGEGEAYPGMLLAINPGGASTQLIGTTTTDPAFGLPAVWIEERQRETAQMAGFTVVDCSTVVATHLSHLMQVHAAKLLGRVETQQLVDHVTKLAPRLIEDVVPKMVGIAALQKVSSCCWKKGCTSATCARSSNAWPSMPPPSPTRPSSPAASASTCRRRSSSRSTARPRSSMSSPSSPSSSGS
jgi:flagellar biosynthesis protein FlhA